MTETTKRVALFTGTVAHLVDTIQPTLPGQSQDRLASLCNLVPMWPSTWNNGGSADGLPLCKTCELVEGAIQGVERT